MTCNSLLYRIKLLCNMICFPASGQGKVKSFTKFENLNLEHIVIFKTEHKEQQFLGAKWRVL